MDRAIYIASNGANQAMQAMQVNSNNLANANVTGFKEDLLRFTNYAVNGGELPTRSYAVVGDNGFNNTHGPMVTTNRSLDIAIKNEGWIAIQAPTGQEAYTRNGSLAISQNGLLTTSDGNLVMGNKGPIAIPPNQRVQIGSDGTVSILPFGSSNNTLAVVDRIKLVNPPKPPEKGGDGLFYSPGGQVEADASVEIITGALEGSNVKTVDAMVNMINLSRYFETQVKLMKTVESNSEKSESIMQF